MTTKNNLYKKIITTGCVVALSFCFFAPTANAAVATRPKTESAIKTTTTGVRARVDAKGLYNQDCYDAYYGCMDQFCAGESIILSMPDEPVTLDGGTCVCSDQHNDLKSKISDMNDKLVNANTMQTVDVEKIKAGAKADIVFGTGRQYDAKGNVITLAQKDAKAQQQATLSLWDTPTEAPDETDLSNMTGTALFNSADNLCQQRMPDGCDNDYQTLKTLYQTQVKSDCTALSNAVVQKSTQVDTIFAGAQKAVRDAQLAANEDVNEYDRGTCMVNFKKCMQGPDACGSDWINCVSATANVQAQAVRSTAVRSTIAKPTTDAQFQISDATQTILNSKRTICESVLDKCMANRDYVWTDFLKEAAPDLKTAELTAESNKRQSCLPDIAACIKNACEQDIASTGKATMAACMAQPEMARSFCKTVLDPCEAMTAVSGGDSMIWQSVKDALAASQVDVCTTEVKDCFTKTCGENFGQCIGMDYAFVSKNVCPLSNMISCKTSRKGFTQADLDSIKMGIFLNADNSALEQCQAIVDTKMQEICGTTADCNKFITDDVIGTRSLQLQKDGNVYRITGMISWGNVRIGDASGTIKDEDADGNPITLKPGQIGVLDYMNNLRDAAKTQKVPNAAGIIDTIGLELTSVAGTVNNTINLIALDPQVQNCVSGRDLSNITGKKQTTAGRFPTLLYPIQQRIAIAAIMRAQQNYNAAFTDKVAQATADASADVAQYMCQKVAAQTGTVTPDASVKTDLMPPFAISYEIGSGLDTNMLIQGGKDVAKAGGFKFQNKGYLGGGSIEGGGVSTTTTAIFSRDSRTCHICRQISITNCKTTGSVSWFHNSRNAECPTTVVQDKDGNAEMCEDIKM